MNYCKRKNQRQQRTEERKERKEIENESETI